jgi:hypothetical protein
MKCKDCNKKVNYTLADRCENCFKIYNINQKNNFKPYKIKCVSLGCNNTAHIKKYGQIEWCEECINSSIEADKKADIYEEETLKSLQTLMIDDN